MSAGIVTQLVFEECANLSEGRLQGFEVVRAWASPELTILARHSDGRLVWVRGVPLHEMSHLPAGTRAALRRVKANVEDLTGEAFSWDDGTMPVAMVPEAETEDGDMLGDDDAGALLHVWGEVAARLDGHALDDGEAARPTAPAARDDSGPPAAEGVDGSAPPATPVDEDDPF